MSSQRQSTASCPHLGPRPSSIDIIMTDTVGTSLPDRLPNELLEIIRKDIGYDLEGQVAFLKLSTRTAALSDYLPAAFWEELCRKYGLGISNAAEGDGWRDVAVRCAEHVWSCTHPACGRARLRQMGVCGPFRMQYMTSRQI